MNEEVKEGMEQTTETASESSEISSAQVREHKLFKQLAKQLSERDAKLSKIEQDRQEAERQSRVQSEVEKGNYAAAVAQIEAAKQAEIQSYQKQAETLARELELTRTSTKLLANGAVGEKAATFLANEYLGIPSDERLPFDKWIAGAKENPEYGTFFTAAQKIQAPADRSGASATRGGSANAKQYQDWMQNPRSCSPAQLQEAIGYHARYVAQNGKPPW